LPPANSRRLTDYRDRRQVVVISLYRIG
jgi:hypothetical protein